MNGDDRFQPWFEKNPELFKEQRLILESAGFTLNQDVLSKERRVLFEGRSKADPERILIVMLPEGFPSCAPKIFDTPPSKILVRHHRGDNRQLCLFGFDENRWTATLTVAAALTEAENLIGQFKDTNPTPENQPPEPLTRTIAYCLDAAIFVPPPISTFDGFPQLTAPTGRFLGRFVHEGEFKRETKGRGVILEATFGDKKLRCGIPFVDYLGKQGKEIHGEWYYLKDPPTQETLLGILKKCLQQSMALKRTDYYWFAVIFREEAGGGQSRLTWLVVRAYIKEQGKFHCIRTFPYIQNERFVRVPGLEGLENKRITVVGCGSLGSKIAANLAASGVRRFHLVDYDYYEPNNAVRHELGVECFGLSKEKALLDRLCALNPAVAENSSSFTFQVGSSSPFDQEQKFYDLVKASDLVIDTVAIHSVSHFLNRLSCEFRIPTLFSTVTNGAWSGEIVRVVPGKTPCWMCWVDQYYDQKPPSAPKPSAEIFAPGCDHPTFTGTTYDLGIVAGLATSLAVETLLPEMQLADFSKNYIRWSGKDAKGRHLFQTEMLPINAQPACCYCGS